MRKSWLPYRLHQTYLKAKRRLGKGWIVVLAIIVERLVEDRLVTLANSIIDSGVAVIWTWLAGFLLLFMQSPVGVVGSLMAVVIIVIVAHSYIETWTHPERIEILDSDAVVSRSEYEAQKRELSHIQQYSPKILDEEQERKLIQQIKTLRLSEVTIRLDASTSSGGSTPLVVQLCHIVEEAGCTLKDERLYRETSPPGGHDKDVWLDAGEEVKAELKSMLEDAGLSVETREQPTDEGRWAKIIVAVKIGQ